MYRRAGRPGLTPSSADSSTIGASRLNSAWAGGATLPNHIPCIITRHEVTNVSTRLRKFQQTRQMHFITFGRCRRQPKLSTARVREVLEHSLELTRLLRFGPTSVWSPDADRYTAPEV